MHPLDIVRLGGVPIVNTTAHDLVEHLIKRYDEGRQMSLFFANTNFIVKCRSLLGGTVPGSVVIVNDGIGMDIAQLLLHGKRFKENLNGTDFLPYFFENAPQQLRVFMIGAREGVVERAAEHVRIILGQDVVGVRNGYDDIQDETALIDALNLSNPDIVLVAMGNPAQEAWICRNRDRIIPCLTVGVGALFDFWAGAKPRAPDLVRKIHMEWFFRLCLEPRRLFRRYTIDILLFLYICRRYR